MPPELLSEGQMSKAADVYAMGVLLWEVQLHTRMSTVICSPIAAHLLESPT